MTPSPIHPPSAIGLISHPPYIIHPQSGLKVSQFERQGGTAPPMMFAADLEGFRALQLIPLGDAKLFIRLTNGDRISFTLPTKAPQ